MRILFGRKSLQKSPKFLRSRNSFLAVSCTLFGGARKVRRTGEPCLCITLTFNSCLDNSHEHVAHGECTRSTNSVSSKLLQLARVALLAWFVAHCALWKSESISKAWAYPNPSDALAFHIHQKLGNFSNEARFVSQVVNDANLSRKDKIRRLKALTAD